MSKPRKKTGFWKCPNDTCNRRYLIDMEKYPKEPYVCPICRSQLAQGISLFDVVGKDYENYEEKQ